MQSGLGVNFLFWSGEFLENCRRISQRILMANFDSEFSGLVFPGFQATQKLHAQTSRPELSACLSSFTFLNPKFIHGDFLLTGETEILLRILLRIFPNFPRSFRASFPRKRRPEKNSPKIPALFQCKIPRQIRKKHSEK